MQIDRTIDLAFFTKLRKKRIVILQPYGVAGDYLNRITFPPFETKALHPEVQIQSD